MFRTRLLKIKSPDSHWHNKLCINKNCDQIITKSKHLTLSKIYSIAIFTRLPKSKKKSQQNIRIFAFKGIQLRINLVVECAMKTTNASLNV